MPIELTVAVVLALGLAIGVVIGWLASRQQQVRLQSELDKDRAVHAERLKAYHEAETKLRDAFQALSADALKTNNEAFLALAETRLREARTEATTDIDARKKAIEGLLAPMAKTLEHVDREIADAERRRVESGAHLLQKIASLDTIGQNLREETRRLTDALKRPGVRGRWGELQLKRVVELAGMIEYCDFIEQGTINGDERRMRPDLVVRLPGGRHVVVDAKVPLDAYLRALEAPDEAARQELLADHARQVRTHLTQLAAKDYAAHVQPSPDFVVMFLPGEMFLSAALEQDPTLIEFGAVGNAKRVIPSSPTTLIALLRAVAYGWQQEAMEENARKISELGRSLYEAVRTLGARVDTLGTRLKSSLEAYNDAVGSLEGNVLVKARKFKELQAANGGEEIKSLDPIDRVPRMLQAPELTGGLPFSVDDVESEEAQKV
ncbi:MAG TPA: DNA recombination protein RmuC [Vicinamibacterales bacterium]|jgi:DNA recombination protein RmuC|nr:DNA recombination protein RmuC [Vicinamibacterales bacterium]